MLISQLINSCLADHSELCMSRLLNNQPRRISIYILQRRPSFGFESSVSSTPVTSGDPVAGPAQWLQDRCRGLQDMVRVLEQPVGRRTCDRRVAGLTSGRGQERVPKGV